MKLNTLAVSMAVAVSVSVAMAADGADQVAPTTGTKVRAKGSKKRRIKSEKDAEGTQALDRFEASNVIKSQYQLNGEALEVDPD